jgi:hypothetical protein
MAVGHQDHERIADAVAIRLGCLDQSFDLKQASVSSTVHGGRKRRSAITGGSTARPAARPRQHQE